ncbi:hypothetical protein [Methylophaga sp. UBA1464]|uniref:hypothetical protein n=1 Tax=Methylophaga sp. UBA1464 TaxID=1946866 RepID=UPI0025FEBFE5|nr:hypothetical protein [Methylophaga sp. UBA1464]
MQKPRIFRLSDNEPRKIRFISDRVDARFLAEDKTSTVVTVTRTGNFFDPRYGNFDITKEMLLSMVSNFAAGVFGQDIVLDVGHMPHLGAAGFFKRLFLDGNKLRGEVELTEYGIEAIRKKGHVYVSAEFDENFIDNEHRKAHGPTLLGAGLTPRPVIKHLDRVQLSEEALDGAPMTLVSDRISRLLNEDLNMNKILKALLASLAALKLSEDVQKQLSEAFQTAAKPLGDDEVALKALQESFEATGKQLAEQIGDRVVTLSIQMPTPATPVVTPDPANPAAKTLSEDDVKRILSDAAKTQQEADSATAKKLSDNQALFDKKLAENESYKALSEPAQKKLSSARELINAEMSADQITRLAENQWSLAADMAVSTQLASMGYQVAGNAHITVDDSNSVKALQETVDQRLGISTKSKVKRFSNTGGELQTENKTLAEKALAQYDHEHAAQLREEHKMLAGGAGSVSDVKVPAIFERTVIREALYNLVGLQFVDAGTLPFAASAMIPYSYRDDSAAGRGDTRRYEGQGIRRGGIIQTSDNAYPIPQKIAFEVSDELRYLTGSGILNYEAVMENVNNAARIVGEDTEQLIFNEILQSSDEFGAIPINQEVIDTDVDGTNNVFVLAHFPVVRPRQIFDLKGAQVGNTTNPVVIEYNSGSGFTAISEFDGTGEQDAGTYYSLDFNMGELMLVDQAGAIVTPADAHTIRASYSRATNSFAFDTDMGSAEADVHWDGFLYRYGLRKSEIEDNRFHQANFGLMSGTTMNSVERAKQFGANNARNGTDLSANGNLGRVKDVPNYKTSAPGLHMGDQRVVIGERGVTRMRMMKPWAMGELENQRDENGRFTGKKEAYGDQFIVLHTPTPLKRAYSSLVLFSNTARVAREAG